MTITDLSVKFLTGKRKLSNAEDIMMIKKIILMGCEKMF